VQMSFISGFIFLCGAMAAAEGESQRDLDEKLWQAAKDGDLDAVKS
jgi:hypothetical protein